MRLCVVAVFALIFSGNVKAIDMFGAVEFTDLSPNASEKVWERGKQILRWDWKLVEGKAATKESKRVRLDFCMNRESRESVEANAKLKRKWHVNKGLRFNDSH